MSMLIENAFKLKNLVSKRGKWRIRMKEEENNFTDQFAVIVLVKKVVFLLYIYKYFAKLDRFLY